MVKELLGVYTCENEGENVYNIFNIRGLRRASMKTLMWRQQQLQRFGRVYFVDSRKSKKTILLECSERREEW